MNSSAVADALLDAIAYTMAPRLSSLLQRFSTAVLYAPIEFHMRRMVSAAVAELDGAQRPVVVVDSTGDISQVTRAAESPEGQRLGILIVWEPGISSPSHGRLSQAFNSLVADIKAAVAGLPSVYLVVEADEDPVGSAADLFFEMRFGPGVALVTESEAQRLLGGTAPSTAWIQQLLASTFGVPGLLAAVVHDAGLVNLDAELDEGDTSPSGAARAPKSPSTTNGADGPRMSTREVFRMAGIIPFASPRAEEVASAWAQRLFPVVMDNQLLHLTMWLNPLPEATLAALATRTFGAKITPDDVRAANSWPFVISWNGHDPTLPPILANAFRLAAGDRHQEGSRRIRTAAARAVVDREVPLSGIDRISLATSISAWGELDWILRADMHLLAGLTERQRYNLSTLWPEQISGDWPYFKAAQAFVTGKWSNSRFGLPIPWVELRYLVEASDSALVHRIARDFNQIITSGLAVFQAGNVDSAREALAGGITRLMAEVEDAHTRSFSSDSLDPAAVDWMQFLCAALAGASDVCLSVGMLAEAQTCVSRAITLADSVDLDSDRAPKLRLDLAARAALYAAKAGLRERATEELSVYDSLTRELGAGDEEPALIARIARRFSRDWVKALNGERYEFSEVKSSNFAPVEIEAECLAILVMRGPITASQMLQAHLARTQWSDLLKWEWWPLHMMLALIDVREGRVSQAEETLELGILPPQIALIIRAGIELSAGHYEVVSSLTDTVISAPSVPDRWRMLAYGMKLGALVKGVDLENGKQIIVGLKEWEQMLGAVALLPVVARRPLVERLPEQFRLAPGLRCDVEQDRRKQVTLTPRQMDVLKLLATDMTKRQIADELFLGTETIRSTTKSLYKRMGVHDREAAVQLGRMYGLL